MIQIPICNAPLACGWHCPFQDQNLNKKERTHNTGKCSNFPNSNTFINITQCSRRCWAETECPPLPAISSPPPEPSWLVNTKVVWTFLYFYVYWRYIRFKKIYKSIRTRNIKDGFKQFLLFWYWFSTRWQGYEVPMKQQTCSAQAVRWYQERGLESEAVANQRCRNSRQMRKETSQNLERGCNPNPIPLIVRRVSPFKRDPTYLTKTKKKKLC